MTPEQIAAVVEEIRERVRGRHRKTLDGLPDFELPSLEPAGQARDAAEGKAAGIGTVNPRPPGLVHQTIQGVKKVVARALNWFVRDQIDFNRAVLRYMDRQIAAAEQQNQAMLALAGNLRDVLQHWQTWRPAWEENQTRAEIELLRALGDAESAARQREEALRSDLLRAYDSRHGDFQQALERSVVEIQESVGSKLTALDEKFWQQLSKLQAEQQRLVYTELRLLRRRGSVETPPSAGVPQQPADDGRAVPPAPASPPEAFDYARFEERFRGSEEHVKESQRFYLPHFRGCRRVLDLGCGRGEFLELVRESGVSSAGVDLSADAVAACREKGLDVEQGDLFAFLQRQPAGEADGILCAHVVEHLDPNDVPRLVDLAAEKLAPGGLLAIETPNPGCLAIFASDFYLDPTHRRPIPSAQLHFLFEEAGLGQIEVRELHSAAEVFPELAALEGLEELRAFRRKFFGGLDYAILGRKLTS